MQVTQTVICKLTDIRNSYKLTVSTSFTKNTLYCFFIIYCTRSNVINFQEKSILLQIYCTEEGGSGNICIIIPGFILNCMCSKYWLYCTLLVLYSIRYYIQQHTYSRVCLLKIYIINTHCKYLIYIIYTVFFVHLFLCGF